jgi:hypothetical protein
VGRAPSDPAVRRGLHPLSPARSALDPTNLGVAARLTLACPTPEQVMKFGADSLTTTVMKGVDLDK